MKELTFVNNSCRMVESNQSEYPMLDVLDVHDYKMIALAKGWNIDGHSNITGTYEELRDSLLRIWSERVMVDMFEYHKHDAEQIIISHWFNINKTLNFIDFHLLLEEMGNCNFYFGYKNANALPINGRHAYDPNYDAGYWGNMIKLIMSALRNGFRNYDDVEENPILTNEFEGFKEWLNEQDFYKNKVSE